jgi:hypothetical protein
MGDFGGVGVRKGGEFEDQGESRCHRRLSVGEREREREREDLGLGLGLGLGVIEGEGF